MLALGIDIGGSGIKGAVVDTAKGRLVTDRIRVATPAGSPASEILDIVRDIATQLEWTKGPVGIGFPGVIRANTICTAVNLHESLVGINPEKELKKHFPGPVRLINDADAAGYAEIRFGAGRNHAETATVLLLTIGTGIGSVLFSRGHLVPNLEMGHVEFKGTNAERIVSERARKEGDLSWKKWGKLFNEYLAHLAFILQPDLIILGGGGVKKAEKFESFIDLATPWTLAEFGNLAGIVGAALAAAEDARKTA